MNKLYLTIQNVGGAPTKAYPYGLLAVKVEQGHMHSESTVGVQKWEGERAVEDFREQLASLELSLNSGLETVRGMLNSLPVQAVEPHINKVA